MFSKKFDTVYSDAATVRVEELGLNPSGWTITGEIKEDWFEWVNGFEATHPDFGRVWGDYEEEVFADSQEAFEHFFVNHPPHLWDYHDI